MAQISRNASLEEKLEHVMREIRLAGYEDEIPTDALEDIIAYSWGHNRMTIKMALRFLKNSKRVSRKAPKVYRVNIPTYSTKKEDETAAENTFAAKTIEEDFNGMLRIFHDRHPPGMKDGPTEDQDMTWIRAVKGRYGLQAMRDRELYKKLREGLA